MSYMTINNRRVEFTDEKNVLSVIRKSGIDLPTFCYHSELSTYGACRMCVVEDDRGRIFASCSETPRDKMVIYTNTPRLKHHRKMIIELLLASHCRDCTTCTKNGVCVLQKLSRQLGIKEVRFENNKKQLPKDLSSECIIRDPNKCILCGDCVRTCDEIQGMGILDFAFRGSKMQVTTAFNKDLAQTDCVGCGQCRAVCPTGAITIKQDIERVWEALSDPEKRVVVQIAPAVRVAVGDKFGIPKGENVLGRLVAALRRIGFDEVYDTATGADLTVIEEANELVGRLEKGERLPLFTSCCPAWFRYAEINHPELMDNISSCKSPMEMFGSVLKERAKLNEKGKKPKKTKVVAIMPCTAKKYEIHREEFQYDGEPTIAHSITTMELANMIREAGLRFEDILPEAVDMPFGIASGAGVIFGVTGGVTEAVIRYVMGDAAREHLADISFTGVRGFEGLKEVKVPYKDRELNIAIVSGLKNAENLIQAIQAGEVEYDFVEVMACEGGCIAGAGQPFVIGRAKPERSEGMYQADRMSNVKLSAENPVTDGLYASLLVGDKAHHLLHYK